MSHNERPVVGRVPGHAVLLPDAVGVNEGGRAVADGVPIGTLIMTYVVLFGTQIIVHVIVSLDL